MYVYDFDKHPPQDPADLVTHSCELNYLWKPDLTLDATLSKQMQTWWTNFAKHHDPNGPDAKEKNEVVWPSISQGDLNPQILRISNQT